MLRVPYPHSFHPFFSVTPRSKVRNPSGHRKVAEYEHKVEILMIMSRNHLPVIKQMERRKYVTPTVAGIYHLIGGVPV